MSTFLQDIPEEFKIYSINTTTSSIHKQNDLMIVILRNGLDIMAKRMMLGRILHDPIAMQWGCHILLITMISLDPEIIRIILTNHVHHHHHHPPIGMYISIISRIRIKTI